MTDQADAELTAQTYHSVAEVGEAAWDALSAGRPFQSARWYGFGERVMQNCMPYYVILSKNGEPVARATFWLIRNEPIPISTWLIRRPIERLLSIWPLFFCRSPILSTGGLILPQPPFREAALKQISTLASEELRRLHGSFLLFAYLEEEETRFTGWPAGFSKLALSEPGTSMELRWGSFEEYLQNNKHRMHQHYRRTKREAADLGVEITRHEKVSDIEKALELIHNVEHQHRSPEFPLARPILENMQMTGSIWLEAHIGNRLVGCLLLLEDNRTQFAFLPGLTYEAPCIYNMLLYEAIQTAFERGLSILRWGSSVYETKRRLGFDVEHNNHVVFQSNGPIFGLISRLAAAWE